MRIPSWTCSLLPLCLAACRSEAGARVNGAPPREPEEAIAPPVAAQRSAAPMDSEGRHSRALDYLLASYDRDGDGAVSEHEYDRSAEAFRRYDETGDGHISAADFDRELAAEALRERKADRRALPVVAWGFQVDDEPERLERDELRLAFDEYDDDRDDRIGRWELEERWFERLSWGLEPSPLQERRIERSSPWQILSEAVDDDGDGRIARVELTAWYDEMATSVDGEGAELLGSKDGPEPDEEAELVATVGAPAPNFTLPTPDGGGTVTLSSFRHERPVALIFGSYT